MLRASTRTTLLAGFALAVTGCFTADHAAANDGAAGGDGGDGVDGGGTGDGGLPGTPTVTRVLSLAGPGDNELRVASGAACGLTIAGSFGQDASFGEPTAGVVGTPITVQGTPDELEIVMAGLAPDLSTRWRAGVFASSGEIELRDLEVSCQGSLALLVGDTSTSSRVTYGVGGGTFTCGRTFVLAVDVATGVPRWAHCAGPEVKYVGVAVQGSTVAVAGKIVSDSTGDDGYVELFDAAGNLTGDVYTSGDGGDDKLELIAGVPSGGFVAGGNYDGEKVTGDDGMIYFVNDDRTAGGRTLMGSIGSASDDAVTAVAAAPDQVWIAGTLSGGGMLTWPAPSASTGYSMDAFVGAAAPPGTSPDLIAGFASTLDHVVIRALDAGPGISIAGEYQGDVIDDAGTTHPGGNGEWPFVARLDAGSAAVTHWLPLTDDTGTNGRVTSITRLGGKTWLGGTWTGTLRAPGAAVLSADPDGFLIEVTGL